MLIASGKTLQQHAGPDSFGYPDFRVEALG
jgi:hypothetical protein